MDNPKDDFLEAEVERALKPYRGRASEEELAALEAMVRDTLTNDPVAVDLMKAARRRVPPMETGDEPAPWAAPLPRKRPADEG